MLLGILMVLPLVCLMIGIAIAVERDNPGFLLCIGGFVLALIIIVMGIAGIIRIETALKSSPTTEVESNSGK